jgi:hypothetical protein
MHSTIAQLYVCVYELDYGATHITDDPCVMDHFSIFKDQMIDLTAQNSFHMKI